MLAPLFTHTGHIFEIYSIGDGLFMKRCLDALASLSNAGVLLSLGGIGFMLGLMVMGGKAMTTGAYKQETGFTLLALILFTIMFGMTSDVVVHDLSGAPGVVPGGAYTVDNVPFGVAAAGSIVSRLGLALAENMEQAYGLPDGSQDGLGEGGYGRSLEWINAVRRWSLPEINDNTGKVSHFKKNLAAYIANCTLADADMNKLDLGQAMQTSDPFQPTSLSPGAGILSQNQFITTPWVADNGTISDVACLDGGASLSSEAHNSALLTEFANAIAPHVAANANPRSFADVLPDQQLSDAFDQIGLSSGEVQKYVSVMAVNSVWTMMLRQGGGADGLDVMSQLMVDQATSQRAYQWGGEESQFRRVARPMIAFFESMIYACAPFMALVIGFGAWGIGMVLKYLILTVWVTLWIPVMSIINLYQLTMIQHAVDAMTSAGSPDPLMIGSMAGSAYFQQRIIEWISTGSMLAASVPAITLMLMFGGAVTASALSSKLQGGDHVNEKLPSADTTNAPAVQTQQGAMAYDRAHGTQMSGTASMVPQYSTGETRQLLASSGQKESAQATSSYMSKASHGLQENWGKMRQAGISSGVAFSTGASDQTSLTSDLAKTYGFDEKSVNASKLAYISTVTATAGAKAGLAAAKNLGINLGAGGQSQQVDEVSQLKQLIDGFDNKVKTDQAFAAGVTAQVNDTLTKQALVMGTHGLTASQNDEVSKAFGQVEMANKEFKESASMASSIGGSQTIDLRQMARAADRNGTADETVHAALQLGGAEAFKEARGALAQDASRGGWSSGASSKELDYMAAVQTLHGDVVAPMDSSLAGDRGRAFATALTNSGLLSATGSAGVASSDAYGNRGVAGDVEQQSAHAKQDFERGPAGFGTVVKEANDRVAGVYMGSDGAQSAQVTGSNALSSDNQAAQQRLSGLNAGGAGQDLKATTQGEAIVGHSTEWTKGLTDRVVDQNKKMAVTQTKDAEGSPSSWIGNTFGHVARGTAAGFKLGSFGGADGALSYVERSRAQAAGDTNAWAGYDSHQPIASDAWIARNVLGMNVAGDHREAALKDPATIEHMNAEFDADKAIHGRGMSESYASAYAAVKQWERHGAVTQRGYDEFNEAWGKLTPTEQEAINREADGMKHASLDQFNYRGTTDSD